MKRKTLAIPVRLVNFSDTSQVLTVFTRDHGLVEAIAKGAHREKNAFQGPFDLAVLSEIVFAERAPDRGLAILVEASVVDGFRGLRAGWGSWSGAAFIVEYLRAVGTHGEPAAELFDLACWTLARLARLSESASPRGALAAVLSAFEARALRLLGFAAPFEACASCGRPWSRSDRAVFFSPQHGGILCGRCREREPDRRGLTVPGKVLRILDSLAAGPPESTIEAAAAIDESLAPPLRRLLDLQRTFALEREMGMLEFLPL